MVLLGSLRAISAVIMSWPGELPNENFRMNDLTTFGINGLGGRVIGSGLVRDLYILLSIDEIERFLV